MTSRKTQNRTLPGMALLVVAVADAHRQRHDTALRRLGACVTSVSTIAAARVALQLNNFECILLHCSPLEDTALHWLAGVRLRSKPLLPCVFISSEFDPVSYGMLCELGAVPVPTHYIAHRDVLSAAIRQAIANASSVP